MRKYSINGLALLFILAFSASAAARVAPDERWLPWIGCWAPDGLASATALCIVPDGDGVRMLTIADGVIESASRVIADGQTRNVTQEGCSGLESARWSADGQRVFMRGELKCGNSIERTVTGIFAILNTREWIIVQSAASSGSNATHSIRYAAVVPDRLPEEVAQAFSDNRLSRETARLAAIQQLDLDDIQEAVAHVEAGVVESWLTARGPQFDLTGKDLLRLADAGVPASVIDVLVAVSNPEHFAVRAAAPEDMESRDQDRRIWPGTSCLDESYYSYPRASWYQPFSYRRSYQYGCGPIGYYNPWGYNGLGWGYGGGTVIVVERPRAESRGKVTKGGYSSGRSTSDDTSAKSRSGSSAQPRPATTGSSASSGSSGSSSSDSKSSGRKAKPRGNN